MKDQDDVLLNRLDVKNKLRLRIGDVAVGAKQLFRLQSAVRAELTQNRTRKVLEGDPPVDLEIRESTWMASNTTTGFAVMVAEQASETEQASVTEEQEKWPEVVQNCDRCS